MDRRTIITALLLVAGAIAANVAFVGLGAVFDYPVILGREPAEILARFRADEGSVVPWFVLLIGAAGLLAPIAILVGRLSERRTMRVAVWVGIAAAGVQVAGLLRWPLLVPDLAARMAGAGDVTSRAAVAREFEFLNALLRTLLGETLGYALTAAWTVLVLVSLGRRFGGRWFVRLGVAAASLIALGVLVPLGLPGADSANFAGYVLWSVWLVAFAVALAARPGRFGSAISPS